MSRDVLAKRPWFRRLIYSMLFSAARIIPRNIILLAGYFTGLATWLKDKNGRKTVAGNLKQLIPELSQSSLERMTRKTYTNFGIACAELLLIPRLKKRHFINTRIIDPWKQLSNAPLKGPLIGVTVHSNWEILPCILHRLGHLKQCHAIALSHDDPAIDNLFSTVRENMGVHSLLLDRAPLETLRALKAGGILALVGDRDYTDHGIYKHVGAGSMKIPIGPAALAIQTNASILPVFACRHGARQYSVVVGKAIKADPNLHKRDQLPKIIDELAKIYERFLRCAPSQWVCFHNAFDQTDD